VLTDAGSGTLEHLIYVPVQRDVSDRRLDLQSSVNEVGYIDVLNQ